MLAQIASYIFLFGLALLFVGETIGTSLNIEPIRDLGKKMGENKMYSFLILYFINMAGAMLMQTGAFEVFVEDELVFSKLETGNLLPIMRLVDIVHGAIQ